MFPLNVRVTARMIMPAAAAAVALASLTGCDFGKDAKDDPSTPPSLAAPLTTPATPPAVTDSPSAQPTDPATTQAQAPAEVNADWNADVRKYRGQIGKEILFRCPAKGTPTAVWGTDIYTDDSSVCSAGVHAGLITVSAGGSVKVTVMEGRAHYNGSARHGISTDNYDAWEGSFKFVPPAGQ